MNLSELLTEAGELQNILHVLKNYQGSDDELLQAKQKYHTMFLESMAAGLARPLFNGRADRKFRATALPISASSLEEPEPEEEEEDEGKTTNEEQEKENCASRD
jgi:hypothetical protein